jgi:hypothetical protein
MFLLSSPRLTSYELYGTAQINIEVFRRLDSSGLTMLRLAGHCTIVPGHAFPRLRHLTLFGIKGNYFDLHALEHIFADCQLDTFSYAQDRLGFELRDHMLQGLIDGIGRSLHRLVLLGCSRITTSALAGCLRATPMLQYLAVSIIIVHELSHQFIFELPGTLEVLKIQLSHSWYTVPKIKEEREVCDALELHLIRHLSSLKSLFLSLRDALLEEDGRRERWSEIANSRHIALSLGAWEQDEDI